MASTLAGWTRSVAAALHARGIDAAPLFAAAGIKPALLDDPDARLPSATTARLWRACVAHTGDPAFGLEVARMGLPAGSPALMAALMASDSLWSALCRLARFIAVVTEVAELKLDRVDGSVRLRVNPAEAEIAEEAIDALMYSVLRLCRSLGGRDLAPTLLRLRRGAPQGVWREYGRLFRCPVSFSSEHDEIWFDGQNFDAPLASADRKQSSTQDRRLAVNVQRLERESVLTRAASAIQDALTSGEPDATGIARRLGLSLRTLQRQLREQGTSFKQLLDDTRRELAARYLRDPALGVGDIAFLLGYSHAASLTHAHVRWTGRSPQAERALASGR